MEIPDGACTMMQSSHHGDVARVRSLRTPKSCQVPKPRKGSVGPAQLQAAPTVETHTLGTTTGSLGLRDG